MDNWQSVIMRAGCGEWADWLVLDSATLNKTENTLCVVFSVADGMSDEARSSIVNAISNQFRGVNVSVRFMTANQVSMDAIR